MSVLQNLSDELSARVESARSSLVHIHAPGAAGRTGIALGPQQVMTLARQAEPGETVTAVTADGTEHSARVSAYDQTSGITVLAMEGSPELVPLAGETQDGAAAGLVVGTLGVTVAFPSPQSVEARLSMVRCVGEPLRISGGRLLPRYIQTDAPAYPGFSGAPFLGADGTARALALPSGDQGDTLYMPWNTVSEILAILHDTPVITVGYLGVRGKPAPVEHEAASEGQSEAFLLVHVDDESPAGTAGLQVGDILLAIDKRPITGVGDLMDSLIGPERKQIHLRWLRSGAVRESEVTLAARRWDRD